MHVVDTGSWTPDGIPIPVFLYHTSGLNICELFSGKLCVCGLWFRRLDRGHHINDWGQSCLGENSPGKGLLSVHRHPLLVYLFKVFSLTKFI